MCLSDSCTSFKTPLQTEIPSSGKPSTVDLTGLTFDLGNECPSGCECLHGVQEWVSGDDLTHDSQSFTQALVGQWPAGFKEVCWAELAWVRRKRLAPAFPASQRSDGETEAGLDGVSPSKFIKLYSLLDLHQEGGSVTTHWSCRCGQ